MDSMKTTLVIIVCLAASWSLGGCSPPPEKPPRPAEPAANGQTPPPLLYIGSSTVANFLQEAEPVYGRARFILDTLPESAGGERAIQDRNADLAGVAWDPLEETIERGVRANLIGTDTIALAVNEKNPITQLNLTQLRGIFTGRIKNWKEVGGLDLEIVPMIVGPESATRLVFRALVLGEEDYGDAKVVSPDSRIPMEVEAEPGGIGTISFSFLCAGGVVRVLSVEGSPPLPTSLDYPIARPLYLLWWPDNARAADFIAWTATREGEEVLLKCFGRPRSLPRLLRPDTE
jgi:phosphate transport system substrate-binding protein